MTINLEALGQDLIEKRLLRAGAREAALAVMGATITEETDLAAARVYNGLYHKIDDAHEIEITS